MRNTTSLSIAFLCMILYVPVFTGMLCAVANAQNTSPLTIQSPEIQPNRSIIFRCHAPQANEVVLRFGDTRPVDAVMTKDATGVWSCTLAPQEPDLYFYQFRIDGRASADPANPAVVHRRRTDVSILEVPGGAPLPHEVQNVPHGAVHELQHFSTMFQEERQFLLYTPPGYGEQPDRRYPILFVLHGGGMDERDWIDLGRAHVILDNLIAEQKAVPMIMVSPQVYGKKTPWSQPQPFEGKTDLPTAILEFREYLAQELLPYIAGRFRLADGREHRAVAGLSNGASHARTVLLRHMDAFGWAAIWSGGGGQPSLDDDLAFLNANGWLQRYPPFYVTIGRGRLENWNQQPFIATIQRIMHPVLLDGVSDHNFRSWRDLLINFTQVIFKPR